jgi:hypothetical protein
MPSIADQLPVLRALWPTPLGCRWNLNPLHGAYVYEPYDQMGDLDLETRRTLVRVIGGTTAAGQNAPVVDHR